MKYLFYGLFAVVFIYACVKDDVDPVIDNRDAAPIIDPDIDAEIFADQFEYPFVKDIGDGVTYYIKPYYNNACGGYTWSTSGQFGLDVYNETDEFVQFVITNEIWLYQYEVCCLLDSICDSGFLIGVAE